MSLRTERRYSLHSCFLLLTWLVKIYKEFNVQNKLINFTLLDPDNFLFCVYTNLEEPFFTMKNSDLLDFT